MHLTSRGDLSARQKPCLLVDQQTVANEIKRLGRMPVSDIIAPVFVRRRFGDLTGDNTKPKTIAACHESPYSYLSVPSKAYYHVTSSASGALIADLCSRLGSIRLDSFSGYKKNVSRLARVGCDATPPPPPSPVTHPPHYICRCMHGTNNRVSAERRHGATFSSSYTLRYVPVAGIAVRCCVFSGAEMTVCRTGCRREMFALLGEFK